MIVTKLAVLLISAFCTGHGINEGAYDSIKMGMIRPMGMTRPEVIATLVAFPGDYRLIPDISDPMTELNFGIHMLAKGFGGDNSCYWASDFGEIYVHFDDHGRATSTAFVKSRMHKGK